MSLSFPPYFSLETFSFLRSADGGSLARGCTGEAVKMLFARDSIILYLMQLMALEGKLHAIPRCRASWQLELV